VELLLCVLGMMRWICSKIETQQCLTVTECRWAMVQWLACWQSGFSPCSACHQTPKEEEEEDSA